MADTVDEYLATLPPDQREVMDALRATINAAAPDAVETIAYSMPALRSAVSSTISARGWRNSTRTNSPPV